MNRLLLIFAVVLLCSVGSIAAEPVSFDVHDGYFVSNTFEPEAPASFVVIRDEASFKEVFGIASVMGDKSHRLPRDAFESRMVLAAIHRGKATWTYKVESVTADGTTLVVKYTATATPRDSASFACPLIISIPKAAYASVQFIENGKEIKSVAALSPVAKQ